MKATFQSLVITLLLSFTIVNASPVPPTSPAPAARGILESLQGLLGGSEPPSAPPVAAAKRQDTTQPAAAVVSELCAGPVPAQSPQVAEICSDVSDPVAALSQLCLYVPLSVCTVPEEAPGAASPAPAKRSLVGDQLQAIGLASQNLAVNNGNTGGAISHSSNTMNSAQKVVTDSQSIELLKELDSAVGNIILD